MKFHSAGKRQESLLVIVKLVAGFIPPAMRNEAERETILQQISFGLMYDCLCRKKSELRKMRKHRIQFHQILVLLLLTNERRDENSKELTFPCRTRRCQTDGSAVLGEICWSFFRPFLCWFDMLDKLRCRFTTGSTSTEKVMIEKV